jgi:hypothetical protein
MSTDFYVDTNGNAFKARHDDIDYSKGLAEAIAKVVHMSPEEQQAILDRARKPSPWTR